MQCQLSGDKGVCTDPHAALVPGSQTASACLASRSRYTPQLGLELWLDWLDGVAMLLDT